jgi:hypothetical protein
MLCPGDEAREIVGHETGESHAAYGKFPIRILKPWVDGIGY